MTVGGSRGCMSKPVAGQPGGGKEPQVYQHPGQLQGSAHSSLFQGPWPLGQNCGLFCATHYPGLRQHPTETVARPQTSMCLAGGQPEQGPSHLPGQKVCTHMLLPRGSFRSYLPELRGNPKRRAWGRREVIEYKWIQGWIQGQVSGSGWRQEETTERQLFMAVPQKHKQ